jgi:amidophosphoribosyltransferase
VSELIKHECGIGLIRLFKPLEYFEKEYGTALWGYNKMYLLMEKQRNRGQDGAGLGCVKLDTKPGQPFMTRIRNNEGSPWTQIFKSLDQDLKEIKARGGEHASEASYLKKHFPYAGEVLLGHLRYGTHGEYGINYCHPVSRTSNYRSRNLLMAGNFNLTNVDYLFQKLVELGQHPRQLTDTETVLERVAHFLDHQSNKLTKRFKKEGYSLRETNQLVSDEVDILNIFKVAAKAWDGGYVMGGTLGNGDAFIARDPNGIRPCYYYYNEDFMVAASERAALSVVFDLDPGEILELAPGHLLHTKGNQQEVKVDAFCEAGPRKSCSFERIYFSRGSDIKIYHERKALGRLIVPEVLPKVDYDLRNTVFSFIPNTAESAFMGMMEGLDGYMNQVKKEKILKLAKEGKLDEKSVEKVMRIRPRMEKSVSKDVKMRTFIADDSTRDDMVAHVYDITQGIVRAGKDNLVCIDDSIVRGTTLRTSILHMLARLKPRKIVIVSSAPQIRYPDCYGIDMANIGKLVAFKAAIELLKDRGMSNLIDETYRKVKNLLAEGQGHQDNLVKEIYAPFSAEEISEKIAEVLLPDNFKPELEIVYQSLENLHAAIPNHPGDWYFSGDYPTPGGNRVVNQAFVNFYEGRSQRAYQEATV